MSFTGRVSSACARLLVLVGLGAHLCAASAVLSISLALYLSIPLAVCARARVCVCVCVPIHVTMRALLLLLLCAVFAMEIRQSSHTTDLTLFRFVATVSFCFFVSVSLCLFLCVCFFLSVSFCLFLCFCFFVSVSFFLFLSLGTSRCACCRMTWSACLMVQAAAPSAVASQSSNLETRPDPFLFKTAQNWDLRCVLLSDPSIFGPLGVPTKTRLESSIKKFNPHFIYRPLPHRTLGAGQHDQRG